MKMILRAYFLRSAFMVLPPMGCSAAPPPPAVIDVAAVEAPPPPALSARWVRTGGATSFGVLWEGERVVLLGGRRAILARDGTLRPELSSLPEPLEELFLVPTAGGRRLAARSAHAVYRLDDPLGPAVTLARTENVRIHAGAGPGVVGVWARGTVARFLDVVTGEARAIAGVTQPGFVDGIAFRSMREGAILLGPAGLFVTGDGGASFRPVGRFDAVEVREDTVVVRAGKGESAVDPATGQLGAMPHSPAEQTPFEAWCASGAGDPVLAAARSGVPLADGEWLLTEAHGGVARVDPTTGAVHARLPLPGSDPVTQGDECRLGRAAEIVWLTCDIADRLKVWPLSVDALPAALGAPVLELPSTHPPVGSTPPSGGVRLVERVRQLDGTWREAGRTDGALADGRSAILRVPSTSDGAASYPRIQIVGPGERAGTLRVETLAPLRFYARERLWDARNRLELVGAIEEDAAHLLSFVMADRDEAFAVTQVPGREAAFRTFRWARLHAGHGIAASQEGLFASTDGGVTWTLVPAPEGLVDASLAEAKLSGIDSSFRFSGTVEVSEAGARIGERWLRLGWGAPAPIEPVPRLGGPALDGDAREPRLVCTSTLAPVKLTTQAKPPERVDLLRPPPVKGGRHIDRSSDIDTGAGPVSLSLDAPDEKATSPATLTLRWTEDLGSTEVLSVTGPAPEGLEWALKFFVARIAGAQVLAVVQRDKQSFLLYGRRGGHLAYVPWDNGLSVPTFGATPDDPLSWVQRSPSGSTIMLWTPGRPPRPLTSLPISAAFPASHGSLPVFLETASTTLFRVLSFPLRGDLPAPTASEPVPLDGWTDLGSSEAFLRRLPVCGAKPPAMTGTLHWPLAAEVDGVHEGKRRAAVDLRVGVAGACIAVVRWGERGAAAGDARHDRRIEADLAKRRSVVVSGDGQERVVTCTL